MHRRVHSDNRAVDSYSFSGEIPYFFKRDHPRAIWLDNRTTTFVNFGRIGREHKTYVSTLTFGHVTGAKIDFFLQSCTYLNTGKECLNIFKALKVLNRTYSSPPYSSSFRLQILRPDTTTRQYLMISSQSCIWISASEPARRSPRSTYEPWRVSHPLYCKIADSDLCSAICVSLDNTFRSASKASVTDSKGIRSKPWKGGMQSMLTERGLTMSWVCTFTEYVVHLPSLICAWLPRGYARRTQPQKSKKHLMVSLVAAGCLR